jgi:hypothetical protein
LPDEVGKVLVCYNLIKIKFSTGHNFLLIPNFKVTHRLWEKQNIPLDEADEVQECAQSDIGHKGAWEITPNKKKSSS